MSAEIIDVIPSSMGLITETEVTSQETDFNHEEEEIWLRQNNRSQTTENIKNLMVPSIDEKDEVLNDPIPTSLINNQFDDDSDDDDNVKVIIGNYEPNTSIFKTVQSKHREMLSEGTVIPSKTTKTRGVDIDAQGIINGQPTFEYDILNAHKDEEKPWRKPGEDMADYFNYGFTEQTWAQYSNRQRHLRSESVQIPSMFPVNPHSVAMFNRPPNIPLTIRPMNVRRTDGRIDVIGSTDQTSRRLMSDTPDNFDNSPMTNNSEHISTTSNGTHHIPIMGVHRPPMMPVPGMHYRPPFSYPHIAPDGSQFFSHGPVVRIRGDRFPYFQAHRPHQPWNQPGMIPVQGYPLSYFPEGGTDPNNSNTIRPTENRSPTPEQRKTIDENIIASKTIDEKEKSTRDDRYKKRHRDHHSSSRYRNEEDSAYSQRSSRRTPTKSLQIPDMDRKSSPDERSSSRHNHDKRSSKRSRDESSSERKSSHHRRRQS